jgi:hypothetical protein
MEAMNNPPLCQFGPGGDYRYTWPASAKPVAEDARPTGLAKLAMDLGLEPELVSLGPAGIQWQTSYKATHLKKVVRSLLEVLRKVRVGSDPQADEKLVASQIAAADAALEKLAPANPQVLAEASAPLAEVARGPLVGMGAKGATIETMETAAVVTNKNASPQLQENRYEDGYTETERYSAVHSGLSFDQRLFPDDAGDRRPLAADQGHRLRARRGTRKKRAAHAGRQAQGSLFAGV